MTRPRHPDKEVEEALRYAETYGWRVGIGGSRNLLQLVTPNAAPAPAADAPAGGAR